MDSQEAVVLVRVPQRVIIYVIVLILVLSGYVL